MNDLWPSQEYAIHEVPRQIAAGRTRICVAGPTGSGKTRVMCELIERFDGPVALYTNRRMLLEQLSDRLVQHGIPHGLRAAGHDPNIGQRVQLCMIQTEDSYVYKRRVRGLHYAQLVLIDEAHVNAAGTAQRIAESHLRDRAALVGFTATPLGIGHMYDTLVEAGRPSELRRIGALLHAKAFAPDEPDTRKLKQSEKTGEYTEGSIRKAIMTPCIFGRVYDHWQMYNPEGLPGILFAPGVRESIWFCEQFAKKGVRSAHIDGEQCWLDGEFMPADQDARDHIASLSKSGEVSIVSNRFVLREGIDWPWLYHGILATCFGTIMSYLQSVGRLLRAFPGMDHVVIQDHGGNWHRHGSPNVDRHWELTMTPLREVRERIDRMREKKDPEPIQCPRCHAIRLSGPKCFECGFEHEKSSRMVIEKNGRLQEMCGDVYRDRPRMKDTPAVRRKWERMYWRSRQAGRSWLAAEALFAKENGWRFPPRSLPYMPQNSSEWYGRVAETPMDGLIRDTTKTPDPALFAK